MNTVVRKLVAKEIYVNRWFILSATIAGVASVLIAGLGGKAAFNIGALTWLTTIIAFGVMIAIYGVMNERKEHSLLFVLSLPLSTRDYVRAKQFGLGLSFLAPWLVASAAAIVLILVKPDIPDGMIPYTVLLCVFMLANFAILLCGALHARSEALVTAAIVVTNMGVSVFMFTVGAIPAIYDHLSDAKPLWSDTIWTVLAVEILTLVLALALPLLVAARRRDFL